MTKRGTKQLSGRIRNRISDTWIGFGVGYSTDVIRRKRQYPFLASDYPATLIRNYPFLVSSAGPWSSSSPAVYNYLIFLGKFKRLCWLALTNFQVLRTSICLYRRCSNFTLLEQRGGTKDFAVSILSVVAQNMGCNKPVEHVSLGLLSLYFLRNFSGKRRRNALLPLSLAATWYIIVGLGRWDDMRLWYWFFLLEK